jgi:GNAT superfamily N-acetyltransferase
MKKEWNITIANAAVHPNFQGKGLGKKLMEFAEFKAKSKGYLEMHLATHVLLTENISYYLHLGWKESGCDDTRVYMNKNI